MLKPLMLVAVLLASVLLYRKLCYKRFVQYNRFPQLPTSLFWGHLKVYNEITKRGKLDRDHDYIFSEIYEMLGRPPLVLMDYRPICRPVVFVTCYEIAEQISRATIQFPASVPKVDLRYLEHVIGRTSILSSQGDMWKSLRKTYNHGFSLQHLLTFLPTMLDKTIIFTKHLDMLSSSQDKFSLVSLTTNLTFDIIGAVIMDVDLDAQHMDPSQRGELIRSFTELLRAYWDDKIHLPWWFKPLTTLKRRRAGKQVDRILKAMIRRKHEEQQTRQDKTSQRSESILSLSLQNAKALPQDLLDITCDQLKTFLLGGHDSPSATLAWVFYELSRCPRAMAAVRAELDHIFGPQTDPETIRAQLVPPLGPELVGQMTYIIAVIKETLRLHTPASTARYSTTGNFYTIRTPTGEELGLDDVIVYNCNSIIHRDPRVYGDTAEHFKPERWLGGSHQQSEKGLDSGTAEFPYAAWRPFERGPRSCIGQEFASIEIRVIIAVIARRYEFTKVGLGELALSEDGRPILDQDGRYRVKSQVYDIRQITARPVDDMMVKVKRLDST
ncbi:cytochrome P450 [Hypoxylon trugodes]|uniref:cytochrome P450 n=1 Tax=Hypoxylon trugodes TaxID=326681 RepID=UPI002199CF7C|nr:cytochrome P450 [Hypoxylon trugodes]KAI1385113.1 cytochrome P450 [Hypoxylon trugodes]